MSPSSVGQAIERALDSFDAQPNAVHVAIGVVMGVIATVLSFVVFWLTLQILVEYFR